MDLEYSDFGVIYNRYSYLAEKRITSCTAVYIRPSEDRL